MRLPLKRFALILCVISSALLFAFVLPGCGGGSHHTLFLIGAGTPSVGSFDIGSSGALSLTTTTTTSGSDPQGIVVDAQRRYCYVLNNAGSTLMGAVLQYAIDQKHGTLSVVQAPNASSNLTQPVTPIPTGIQPSAIAIDPKSNFVFVSNYGSDSISVFALDQTDGALTEVAGSPVALATGSKPISLVARGGNLFVANQGAGTVAAYSFSSAGALTLNSMVTVGANTTSITSDPGGKYVFVADGTANTVTTFTVSGSSLSGGTSPTAVGTGPSNLYVDPSGSYLYVTNSGSGNLSGFTIGSGSLSPISGSPFTTGAGPSFVTSNSSGNLLFVANGGAASVSSFQVGGGGALTAASGSPYEATGYNSPNGLASAE